VISRSVWSLHEVWYTIECVDRKHEKIGRKPKSKNSNPQFCTRQSTCRTGNPDGIRCIINCILRSTTHISITTAITAASLLTNRSVVSGDGIDCIGRQQYERWWESRDISHNSAAKRVD